MAQITKFAYGGDLYAENDKFYYFNEYGNRCIIDFEVVRDMIFEHEAKVLPVESLRKNYFALRDMVWKDGGSGYYRHEIHNLAKQELFPKLIENPDNFIEGGKDGDNYSVTWLSETGWKNYIELFKAWAAENFNIYL